MLDVTAFDAAYKLPTELSTGSFLDKMAKEQVGGPDGLLYLRLRKDGKYECVSGQLDRVYSVRWLNRRP